jgi:single-strand DNA-binding protein
VSGELTQREYQVKDGTTKTSLDLNANIIDLIGKRNEASQSQQGYQPSGVREHASSRQGPNHDNFDVPYDDDIPF